MKTTPSMIPTVVNTHGSSMEAMPPLALSQRPCQKGKLSAFDPLLHGVEVIQASPNGVELGWYSVTEMGQTYKK